MLNESITVECCVLKIFNKLNGTEVTCVYTKLTEHAISKVILIVEKNLTLLAISLGNHLRCNLDSTIRTSLLAKGTCRTLILAILILEHD